MRVQEPEGAPVAVSDVPRGARSVVGLLDARARERPGACAARVHAGGGWTDVSWGELARRVRAASDGLVAAGLRAGDRVAVLSETRLEAVVADLAVLAAGGVTVPIYPSELARRCGELLALSGAAWAFHDGDAQAAKLREVRPGLPALREAFRLVGAPADGERTLADLARAGEAAARPGAYEARAAALGPGDVACLVFTSGTTGRPKAVVLTHDNFLYCAAAFGRVGVMTEGQVGLMFLPLAHVMGKMVVSTWLGAGATLAFARAIDTVLEDAAATRPTAMAAPPRLFEKAYGAAVAKGRAEPGAKGWLFRTALEGFEAWSAAADAGRAGGGWKLALGRALVFPKVARAVSDRFGGRMRFLVSGSAPLSTKVSRFFSLLGLPILQGYGLTESTGCGCATPPDRLHVGTVGPPLPGGEVRIAPDGEILLRNPGVMRGYWDDPAATAEALRDGWLRTGDVGELDPDGCLRITDRKKELIKTSGGKFVAPQAIESALRSDPLVANALVHGDGRNYVTALVTLAEDAVRRWAEAEGHALAAPLAEDPRVRARIQAAVDGVNADLPRYATVKRFAIVPGDFSQAGGELTPTLKLRRRFCAEKYAAVLDALYEGPPPPGR